MPNAPWATPFLSGVVAAVAASQILSQLKKKTHTGKSKNQKVTTQKSRSISVSVNDGKIMDSPDLDNRILRKAETALQLRTSRLIIVVERCTNDHNYSAILRTAEALGIQHVYIISPQSRNATLRMGDANVGIAVDAVGDEENKNINLAENVKLHRSNGQQVKRYSEAEVKDRANHHLFAQRALEWIEVTEFDTTKECVDKLRKDGYDIWSTDLSQVAVTLDKEGLTDESHSPGQSIIPEKLAIVFGTEAVGCSTEILEASDKRVYLPLRGFADSLNLSVATALVVHHLFILDPSIVGSMSEEERIDLRRKWYTKLATQRILTKSDKQKRKRLIVTIKGLEELEHRQKHPGSNPFPLKPEQLTKLAKLPKAREEMKQFEDAINAKALSAIEDLVNNPPEIVSDMRRHDGEYSFVFSHIWSF
jgi:tRNA G18 (ribose-2'-O)-methylase SpoU